MRFEWDEAKRLSNLAKHGLDLLDAELVFRGSYYSYPSKRQGEERWVTVDLLEDREVAVVWTARDDATRIRARYEERWQYRKLYGGRA